MVQRDGVGETWELIQVHSWHKADFDRLQSQLNDNGRCFALLKQFWF